MIEQFGNLWIYLDEHKDQIDAICCTTNMIVKRNGELVMGAGVAKEFADNYKWLPKHWGERLNKGIHLDGFMVTQLKTRLSLVALPTKRDWKEDSTLELVEKALGNLNLVALMMGWKNVLLPRPGCGKGNLDWKTQVKPLCENILYDDRFVIINNGT